MHIHISTQDGVPIYRQIVNQIKRLVASGRLKAGDEMPPIRHLAQQLLINPNTVARAYRELEGAGVLLSRQGSGTRVSDNGSPLSREEKMKILSERADALIIEARQLGVELEEVVELVRRQDNELGPSEQPKER
ncbi:MAG: GntR family transcriptional regulator [Candidatus Hydrogenedentes bacterium]|nr:GntR family transcriptional regulator [Candidatus Hydrogenedentota bacterium]